MAIPKRRLKQIVRYCDITFERPRTSIDEMRYKVVNTGKKLYFDAVSYKNFFYEYAWDVVKTRKLHKYTAIKYQKLYKKSWLDSRDFPTPSQYRRKKQHCAAEICDFMMQQMFEEMCDNNNKLLFPINWKGRDEGWYKLGVFYEKMDFKLEERLILALLPHNKEIITKYYPIAFSSPATNRRLKLAFTNPKVKHEDINISERIAENNRLSGFYRCFRQRATH